MPGKGDVTQFTHDYCSCLTPLRASRQLQHLLAVLGSSQKLGQGCAQLLALLWIKAGDEEDYLEDELPSSA